MSDLLRELGTSARSLRRTPAFSLLVILTLATGLAVNITLFSVVHSVLLEPLPLPEPDRVMRLWSSRPDAGHDRMVVSPHDLDDWRRLSSSFTHLAAVPSLRPGGLVLTEGGSPAELRSTLVTESFFEVLGVPPLLGRTLSDSDQEEGANLVTVLSEGLWRQRFGSDPGIVGRTISMSGDTFEIVGVMPRRATYPAETQLWAPLSLIPESGVPRRRDVRWLNVIGRLAPGVSAEAAEAELSSIASSLAAEYPDSNEGLTGVTILGLKESLVGDVRQTLLVLYGAVGFVLLIVCANVASLMLTRAQRRQTETAVRRALGARTGHLLRTSFTEAMLLSVTGGLIGLGASAIALRYAPSLLASHLPPLTALRIDTSVVIYSLCLTIVTAIIFGVAPALQGRSSSLTRVLSDVSRGSTSGVRTMLARRSLVVFEVGIVVVLAIAAGVLVKDFNQVRQINPGIDTENVLIVDMNAAAFRYPETEQISTFYAEVCEKVGSVPGVAAVGVVRPVPLTPDDFGGESLSLLPPGETDESKEVGADLRFAGPGTFASLGVPLLDGREFDARESRDTSVKIIINESLAEKLFKGESRIVGRVLPVGEGIEIIGVVGNVRHHHPTRESVPAAYVSIGQITRRGMSLAVRTEVPPMQLAEAVRAAIADVDPEQPIRTITTTGAIASSVLGKERLSMSIFSLFATLALLIAIVGVTGTLGFTVAQRTREIGVRMAIGARPSDITRLILREGLMLTSMGVLFGLGSAYLLSGTLAGLVHGVTATDLSTWVVAVAVILATASLASWIPARRAAQLDPASVMRVD